MWAWTDGKWRETQVSGVSSYLEEHLRSEENVDEAEPEEGGESGGEHPSKVEILPVRSHQRGPREAGEHRGGDEQGGGYDAGVHHDGELEQGAQAQSCQEAKPEQHSHPGGAVLSIVRGQEQPECEASSEEGAEDAPTTEEVREEVDVGSSGGGQDSHGQAGVDIFQVAPDVGLTEIYTLYIHQRQGGTHSQFRIERVEKVVNSRHFLLSAN